MAHHNHGHGGHGVRLELEFLAASRRSGSRSKSSSSPESGSLVRVRAKVESGSDPDTYSGPDPNYEPSAWRFLYNSRASCFWLAAELLYTCKQAMKSAASVGWQSTTMTVSDTVNFVSVSIFCTHRQTTRPSISVCCCGCSCFKLPPALVFNTFERLVFTFRLICGRTMNLL